LGLVTQLLTTTALLALLAGAHCGNGPGSDCPLQIRQYYLSHKAPQVVVRNKATYPVGQIVVHAAYQDLFNTYHEPTQAFDTILQPDQQVTLSLPPIQGSIEWESLSLFATCRAVDRLDPALGMAHLDFMPTYVARIDRDGEILLERADVTVEILGDGDWRARFFIPPGSKLARGAKLRFAFADGREGQAHVDHVHRALAKKGPRLVEVAGIGPLG
jgi:hypothetical protein